MSTVHRLGAIWAISSKTPGESQGYEINSGPEGRSTAARLHALAESLGTPAGSQIGHRDALPWIAFTGGGHADEAMVALAFIAWSDERDFTHQPITPARMIWLPWESAGSAGLDHMSFWRGVDRLRWPEVDLGPEGATGHSAVVEAPRPHSHWGVGQVEPLPFDILMQIAAHLVDGSRVAIVLSSSDLITTEQRLAVLDAVLALLPFGARNCLTVATWASYRANHNVALTFCERAQPGQISYSWRGNHQRPALQERGRAYWNELKRIAEDGHDIARIIGHLATKTEPLKRITEIDLEVLTEIRYASVIHDKVLRNTASAKEVGRALRDSAVNEDQTVAFARFLSVSVGSSDRKEAKETKEIILSVWQPVFATTFGELCRNARDLVSRQEVIWLELCREANKRHDGASSAYLAGALRPPEVIPGDGEVITVLANLVLEYLVNAKTINTRTYDQLVGQRHVLVRALSGLLLERQNQRLQRIRSKFHDNIKSIVSELAAHSDMRGPAWLRPILLASLAQPDRIQPNDVDNVADLGYRAMSCFIDLLAHRAGLYRSLDIGWAGVVRLLNTDFENACGIVRTLLSATHGKHERPTPGHRARIDVLNLLCDAPGQPAALVESTAGDGYRDAFQNAVAVLNSDLHERLSERVAGLLDNDISSLPPTIVEWLGGVLDGHLTARYLGMLEQSLNDRGAEKLYTVTLTPNLLQQLVGLPGLAWFASLRELDALVKEGGSVAQVIDRATRAVYATPALGEIVRILSDYVDRADIKAVDLLLRKLLCHSDNGKFVVFRVRDHLHSSDTKSAQRFVSHINHERHLYTLLSSSDTEPEGTR